MGKHPITTHTEPLLDFEIPPDNRPRWFKYVLVLLAIGIATAFFLWNLGTRKRAFAAAIPARPAAALAPLPGILRDRIAAAEHRALSGYGGDATAALAELASLYHANGLLAQASQIYSALIRLDPKDPRWPFFQAAILSASGRLDEALPLLQAAQKLAPGRIPLRLQLAGLLLKINRPADASALYRSVTVDEPGNLHAILGLARIDIAAQSWPQARSRLILATQLHPDIAEPWNLLATVHEKLNQPANAKTNRNRAAKARALPRPPDDWIDSLAYDCYDASQIRAAAGDALAAGDTSRSIALLNHALDFAPDDAATHRQLGKLQADLGDAAQARAHLERATYLAPADADAWASLVALDNAASDTASALDNSALAIAHCPRSGAIRYEYARALKATGDLDAALLQFQESRRLSPGENTNAGIEIALIHLHRNRLDESAAELRAVLEADPGQPVALTTMARLAIDQNNAAEAAQWIARAAAEPRVPRADIDRLNELHRHQFGRPPASSN